jgi:signal transduction histidine kinase
VISIFIAHSRTERVIAAGRVLLAAIALLNVWLDPPGPLESAAVALVLLAAYLGYAIGLVPILRPAFAPAAWWPILTHAVDLAAFALFMQFTAGTSSPFYIYFLFPLTAATLRWQWRGALVTGAAALVLFIAMVLYAAYFAPVREFDVQIVVSRSVTLGLVTVMLAYLGAAHEHGLTRLKSLAAWPRQVLPDRAALVRDIVESVAIILGAPRLLLVWESEEPWVDVASWTGSRFAWRHEPPGTFGTMVAEPLRQHSFICPDASRTAPRVVYAERQRVHWWRGEPLDRALRERFEVRAVTSWPVHEEGVHGRLFCLDKEDITVEDLVYGDLLAGLVASRLAHADLVDQLRQRAFAEDRLRLARDLHDGVLQSLTAAALQIQAARRLLPQDPVAAEARLRELQKVIAAEHVDIRGFIEQLKPGRTELTPGNISMGSHLTELASRIKRQWGVDVHVAFEPDPLTIPEQLATDAYLLAHEALVNAARHARATKVFIAVLGSPDNLSLVVSDDGQGFGFTGRLTLAELKEREAGPVSLRDRVSTLGGDITIESGPTGSRVQMDIPLVGVAR